MVYYAVLAGATLAIGLLSVAVWRSTRQLAFLVGFAFLYYWSLYGGWLVVNRGLGADKSYRFEYLYYKLFPVYLDQDYLWTLILYTIFVVVIQLTVLVTARRPRAFTDAPDRRVCISHGKVVWLAAVLAAGAYAIVWEVVLGAAAGAASGYGSVGQGNPIRLASLYQILHQSALTFTVMGLSVLASGSGARYIVGSKGPAAWGYALVLPAIFLLNLAMGNRSMLAFGTAGAGLFYMVNTRRPNKALIAGAGLLALTSLVLLGILRSSAGQRELGDQHILGKVQYTVSEALSQDVEAFAAHASMYGTLQRHVPLTYGSSLVWLATSVIPGAIRPEIVPLAYFHYASHVGASPDQGFTLHHATGWYLNFGVPGLILGAVLLGLLWARLFNAFHAASRCRSHFGQVFSTVAFWNLTAYLPIVIRSGPEGYKGVGIECLLIPALLMLTASLQVVKIANRASVVPLRLATAGSVSVRVGAVLLATIVSGCTQVQAQPGREWYASPNGTSQGDGTRARPIDLASALDGRRVTAGSTVWLLDGIYRGVFNSTLTGTADAPITVRQHPSGRAIIADDRDRADGATIGVRGAWTIYRDFEVTNTNENRRHGTRFRPMGFEVQAPHTRFINLTVYDTGMGFGFWKEAVDSELYGNVIFNSGTENVASDSRHGHGIYAQNDGGTKLIRENILINQYGFGIHVYPNPGGQTGFRLEGNVVAESGAAKSGAADSRFNNILVSAYRPYEADRIELIENFTYLARRETGSRRFVDANVCLGCTDPQRHRSLVVRNNYFAGGAPVAILSGWQQLLVRGNTFIGADAMVAVTPPSKAALRNWDWDDNDYIGTGPRERPDVLFALDGKPLAQAEWSNATGFDRSSRFRLGRPDGTRVFVRRNQYEPGRGHVIVYNWAGADRVAVDLTAVLTKGARFQVRNAMDYLGAPVAAGVFTGATVTLPLVGLRVTPPRGRATPLATTNGEFGVFVVTTVIGDAATVSIPSTLRPSPVGTAPDPASLNAFVGRFVSRSPAGEARTSVRDGQLHIIILNEPARPEFLLTPVSPTRFRLEGAPAGFFATFDVISGVVRSLTIERGKDQPVTLVRQ